MFDEQPTLELLFQQQGLDAEADQIDNFIESHQLDQNTPLHKANFWSKNQHDGENVQQFNHTLQIDTTNLVKPLGFLMKL